MPYNFIIGRSGSGKTTFALEQLIKSSLENKDMFHIVIVPEQYTMQIQKEIVRLHPRQATTNIDVLSFNRLALKVFKELNINLPNILDDIAKTIILKKVANDNKNNLFLWKDKFSKYGFLDKFKSLISELYQYNIKAEQIKEILADSKIEKTKLLENKLLEIDLLYTAFSDYIKGKHIVNEEVLDILTKHLSKSKMLKGAYLVFDSFTGFTPIQYKLVEILMSMSTSSIFSICADTEIEKTKLEEDDLFYMSMFMLKQINNLADRNMIKQAPSIYLDNTYIESESLRHLEKYFLRDTKVKKIAKDDDINIISTNSLEDEISFITNKINELIKIKGYRYKDIAIISGDLSRYADKLSAKFKQENIPYHIDSNIKISTNIFVEFINILLELISSNYSYDAVMRYIRNPFSRGDIGDYALYSLDNYMYLKGISSYKKFSKPFKYLPKSYKGLDLERLNIIRENILEQTKDLYLLLNPAKDPKNTDIDIDVNSIINELENIFIKLDVENSLLELSEEFANNSDEQRAREYEGVYEKVIDLFSTLSNLLEGEKLKKKEFLDLFKAGLSQIEIGLIPAVIDSIFVGDIIRSRPLRTKAVFIMGMNEGIIPNTSNKYALINDREKEFLEEKYKLKLSQTVKQSIYEQKYYLYLAMSKANNNLYFSYSNTDENMKAIREAAIFKNIRELYTSFDIYKFDKILKINSINELKEEIFASMGINIDNAKLKDSITRYLDAKSLLKLEEMSNFEYKESNIGKEISNKLFGEILKISVSSLEKYAACPYRHFIQYGLRLSQRQKYSIASVDIGNLVHQSLEIIFKDYIKLKKDKKLGIESYLKDIDTKVKLVVEEILAKEEENKYIEDAKSKYIKDRVISLLKLNIEVLFYQLSKGRFEPDSMELPFDIRDDKLYDIQLDDNKKMYLSGKIDRVDIYNSAKEQIQIEGENICKDYLAIKVVDYKTGNTKWDSKLISDGLQLQLAFYLDICMKIYKEKYKKEIEPAAMLYATLIDKFISRDSFEKACSKQEEKLERKLSEEEKMEVSKQLLFAQYKADGLINKEPSILKALDNDLFNYNTDGKMSTIIDQAKTEAKIEDEEIKSWTLSFGKYSKESSKNVLGKEEILSTLEEASKKIKELAKDISDGCIKVYPYYDSKFSCSYCDYKSICGFDKKIKGYEYRMPSKKEEGDE